MTMTDTVDLKYWRGFPLTTAAANAIYDVLVEMVGALEGQRADFVRSQEEGCVEYRFIGQLGMGGKFWNNNGRWYVNCYPEDVTRTKKRTIKKTDIKLAVLRREHIS
jgi:hypothetical protein